MIRPLSVIHGRDSDVPVGDADALRTGDNISNIFKPFLLEAKRVLRPNGVVFVKLADLVHNHKTQWQHVYFINECIKIDLTACDMLIKKILRGGNLKSDRWLNVKHFRKYLLDCGQEGRL